MPETTVNHYFLTTPKPPEETRDLLSPAVVGTDSTLPGCRGSMRFVLLCILLGLGASQLVRAGAGRRLSTPAAVAWAIPAGAEAKAVAAHADGSCVVTGDFRGTTSFGVAGNLASAGSVDVALSDLPFGNRHAKLDVGALLAELWRVLRPGGRGRALLVVKAMDRAKLERAARSHSAKKPWRCEGATAFASGGIDVVAVLFVREGPPATPPRAAARAGGALTALGCRIARLEAGERAAASTQDCTVAKWRPAAECNRVRVSGTKSWPLSSSLQRGWNVHPGCQLSRDWYAPTLRWADVLVGASGACTTPLPNSGEVCFGIK